MTQTSDSLDTVLAQLAATAARPQYEAMTLPRDVFVSDSFFALEQERVLKRGWIALEHVSRLPESGSFACVDLFGEPLVVVRGSDGQIRVLSRVCRHRGMDMVPPEYGRPQQGRSAGFVCPYHRWTYDLTGRLVGAAHMNESAAFKKSELYLRSFRSEVWLGFIWVTFDDTIPPVAEHFGDLDQRLRSWRPETLRAGVSLDWDCAFNWKLLVDNFMEPYHHIGAHATNFGKLLPAGACWTEDECTNYVVGHLPIAPEMLAAQSRTPSDDVLPEVPHMQEGDRGEWQVYLGYPSFLVITAPDKLYWYRLIPIAPGRMKLTTVILFDPLVFDRSDIEAQLEREREALKSFHLEDMEVCTASQNGIASTSYVPGPLSHLEKPAWLFQRYLARQLTGAAPQQP